MIKTNRLILKKPELKDADILSDILSSPEQTRYLPNEAPYSEEQQKTYLENRIKHWQKHNFGTFIIRLNDSSSPKLGFVGIEYAPNPEFVDIRFGLAKQYEGKGFITEAANVMIDWASKNTALDKIYGCAMPENKASNAVLKKLRMKIETNVDLYNYDDLITYSIKLRHR